MDCVLEMKEEDLQQYINISVLDQIIGAFELTAPISWLTADHIMKEFDILRHFIYKFNGLLYEATVQNYITSIKKGDQLVDHRQLIIHLSHNGSCYHSLPHHSRFYDLVQQEKMPNLTKLKETLQAELLFYCSPKHSIIAIEFAFPENGSKLKICFEHGGPIFRRKDIQNLLI